MQIEIEDGGLVQVPGSHTGSLAVTFDGVCCLEIRGLGTADSLHIIPGSLPAKKIELLVDADTHSIHIIQHAIRLLEKAYGPANTTIYAPKQRQQNKKWLQFLQQPNVHFRPVNRKREDGRAGEEVDEAIARAVRSLRDAERTDSIALLTRDTDYLEVIQDALAHGKQVVILAEENCRSLLRKFKDIGADVCAVPTERGRTDGAARVSAILYADGSGSVNQSSEALEAFDTEKAEHLMQLLEDLDYRGDCGYLIQSAVKFWFENSLGNLTVYPQTCALHAVREVMLQSRHCHKWARYKFNLAFAFPVTSLSGSKAKLRRIHGSMRAAAVFKGGGPFMLRDSDCLTADVLRRLGYLDARFNTDLAEAMEAFLNRTGNKHVLRKLQMLPTPHDSVTNVDERLRAAFLSHSTKGFWQVPAADVEVRQILHKQCLLPEDKAPKSVVLKAMRTFARRQGLPMRRTYNLNAIQIMHQANTNPTRIGWVDFRTS